MTFDSLLGNESLKQALQHALRGRFPQSILLTGPAGIGKMTTARILTAALLCESKDSKPCSMCTACRKVMGNVHSDVSVIDLGDAEIKVDVARTIRSECAILPGDSDRRVFLIRHAHNMNASAQNALLKLLEEPPSYAFFILMTENAGAILPTILSRCTRFALAPLDMVSVMRLLQQRYPDKSHEEIQIAAAGCQGIAGDAIAALSEDTSEITALVKDVLTALTTGDELEIFRASEHCSSLSRQQFSHVLTALRTAIRDAVFAANGMQTPLLPALRIQSEALAGKATVRQLLALYDWMGELDERIERNPGMALLTGCLAAGCYERLRGE
ncbi:MAG: DNA polymerase III subunit [Eubacteriales bacterium]|nr:DNA polymerase III subunit [Eubacteriales bacterium]